MKYTKEDIISEIKDVACRLNVKTLRKIEFAQNSDISISSVRYHSTSWTNALIAAGLEILTPDENSKNITDRQTIDDNILLIELLKNYYKHGKITYSIINSENKFSTKPYTTRWGSPQKALDEALKRANEGIIDVEENEIIIENNNFDEIPPKIDSETNITTKDFDTNRKKRHKEIFGQPIDFRGLRFAPINEQGVVYLFGMISNEIGFYIESIRTGFPDCEGKRCFDKKNNLWEHVKIEFEFKSSNFIQHGHNPDECDVIVCWQNDWNDCPLEVIELKEEIRKLPKIINY
jgi:hypothetical protein